MKHYTKRNTMHNHIAVLPLILDFIYIILCYGILLPAAILEKLVIKLSLVSANG